MENLLYANMLLPLIRNAGQQMREAHADAENHVSVKPGDANFVTLYDVQIQESLINGIQQLFPDACFIAEEQDNQVSALAAEHCFIIDPIDGTTNFIHDCRFSCVSVAMFSYGEPIFGAVYNPYADEMFCAERGKGAYLNGQRMQVSSRPFASSIAAFGTAPYYKQRLCDATFALSRKLFLTCADLRRAGSAALDLAYLAAGRVDLFFELLLSPWDIAAGYLLVTESGGILTGLKGEKIDFSSPSPVLAGTPTTHRELLRSASEVVET